MGTTRMAARMNSRITIPPRTDAKMCMSAPRSQCVDLVRGERKVTTHQVGIILGESLCGRIYPRPALAVVRRIFGRTESLPLVGGQNVDVAHGQVLRPQRTQCPSR